MDAYNWVVHSSLNLRIQNEGPSFLNNNEHLLLSTRHFSYITAFEIHHHPARWAPYYYPRFADGASRLREVTRPVNSSTQIQARLRLTPKPSLSHTPGPFTTTQSHPRPFPCDWQSPSRTDSLKMDMSPRFCLPTHHGQGARKLWALAYTTSLAGAAGMDPPHPGFRQDAGSYEGSLCLQSVGRQAAQQHPPRTLLGRAGPHLKASMTTSDSSL